MKNYHKKPITNQELYDELQKIKKVLGILLDKEGIRESDLENQRRLKLEADKKANALMERTQQMFKSVA